MLNVLSLVVGVIALLLGVLAFFPFLGWAYWLIIPIALVGAGLGVASKKTSGRNLNLVVIVIGHPPDAGRRYHLMLSKLLAASASLLLLAACAAAPMPAQPDAPCPIIASRDWKAWVNAMPGPDAPSLIVTGRATVPTGGYRLKLERGPVQEIHPPIQQILLQATSPTGGATQAVVEHEVRATFPALDSYGAVTVHCGGRQIATIPEVERAF